jgi:Uma2 family endonuclease
MSYPLRSLSPVSTSVTLLTADEFLSSPDMPEHAELIEGEVVVTSPEFRHQALVVYLIIRLSVWVEAGPRRGVACIEVDHRLNDRNVFAPDVWWVAEDRRPARDAKRFTGPPDLAIEVRSDSTWRYDVGAKKRVYEHSGLRELWLVDTASNSVLVFRRSAPDADGFDVALELAQGDTLTSPHLPEFTLDVTTLFDR